MEKKYFYGNEISEYGVKNGYVDYRTLSKSFDCVLCNNMSDRLYDQLEQVSGYIDNSYEIEDLETQIYEGEESGDLSEKEIDDMQEQIDKLREEERDSSEIYQWYIVSDNAKDILEMANEMLFFDNDLEVYVWGVTHCGTSWDYVLTSIKID